MNINLRPFAVKRRDTIEMFESEYVSFLCVRKPARLNERLAIL